MLLPQPTTLNGALSTTNNAENALLVEEGNYAARIVRQEEPLLWLACQRLRHAYFVQQRRWVADNVQANGLECDVYDTHAWHLGVFDESGIVAYLRVLPHTAPTGFMLKHEFACLLDSEASPLIFCSQVVELSRLVYQPSPLSLKEGTTHPVEVLLKLLYRLALDQGFHRFYIVVEEKWIRPFARRFGLVFTPIGTPYVFPDGTRTVAATATLTELQESMKAHSLAKYEWYHSL